MPADGAGAGDLVAAGGYGQLVCPSVEGEPDVAGPHAQDYVAGHGQVASAVVGPRDGYIDVPGSGRLALVVGNSIVEDRRSHPALGRTDDAVPRARCVAEAKVFDVVAVDGRPVEAVSVDGIPAVAIQVIARDVPAGGIFEMNGVSARRRDLVINKVSI